MKLDLQNISQPEEESAMDIVTCTLHKKFEKDGRVVPDMLADRQTRLSQYSALPVRSGGKTAFRPKCYKTNENVMYELCILNPSSTVGHSCIICVRFSTFPL